MPLIALSFLSYAFPLAAAAPYGQYLSWWKALLFVVVFFAWLKTLLWIDKDAADHRLPREAINAGEWAVLVAGFAAAVLVPLFAVAFSVFVLLALVGVGGYLIYRKQQVGLDDLPEAFGTWVKNLFKSKKQKAFQAKDERVGEGALTLMNKGGVTPAAPADDDPQRPAYDAAQRVLLDPLYKNADRIVFANAGSRHASKFRVDGVEYPGTAVESDVAAGAVDWLKNLAGLDADERRKQQKGKIKAKIATGSHDLDVTTSGTRTGETMLFEVDRTKRYRDRATALGMTPQQREVVAEAVGENKGVVLAAAPVGGGLSALLYGFVQEHDAFVQHIITSERQTERELEGTTQTPLEPGADAAAEAKQLSWIVSQEPDVLMVAGLEGREAARSVIRLATGEERRRAYVGVRADDVAGALKKWRALVGDDKAAVSSLAMIVAGRSMRKLCDLCKEAYTPNDAALAKMGLPKGRVKTLYRARTEPMLNDRGQPVPCENCGQLGYKGRVGAFEVLRVDDETRRSLVKDPGTANVRNLIRGQKLPTLTEAAVRAVVSGATDLQEVQRVMSPPSESAKKPPAAGKSPPGKPAAAKSVSKPPQPAAAAKPAG